MEDSKVCNKCKEEKELKGFGIYKYSRDGFRQVCKLCRNIEAGAARRKIGIPSKEHIKTTVIGKICTKCGLDKAMQEYGLAKKSSDGHRSDCKECAKNKRYLNYQINKEVILDLQKQYRQQNKNQIKASSANKYKNNKPYYIEKAKNWAINNPDKRKNYLIHYKLNNNGVIIRGNLNYRIKNPNKMRLYRIAHKERLRLQNAFWRKNNPDKVTANHNNRRARKRMVGGFHTAQEWNILKKKYDYTCLRCGKKEPEIKLTEDHVFAISLGGWNSISNIQPLCGPCNSSKQNKYQDYRPDSKTYGEGWKRPSLWG
jgi:5-methylcytosine-specific restriction endonuclease McrA